MGSAGFTVIKPKLDPLIEAEIREESREKKKQEDSMKDLRHIGSVSMDSANHDLVFELVQAALAESREADGEDGLIVGSNEQYDKLERRLTRAGFRGEQVRDAAEACATLDLTTVMDHLVLHTPENQLPASLREKKQTQQQAQAGARGGAVQLPKNQNAFLAPPIVVLPGMAFKGGNQAPQPAQQTLLVPNQLKPKEERSVMELMSLGFERGEVLQALKLSNGKSQPASLMLIQSFSRDNTCDANVPGGVDDDDIEEARFDERTALESIYGEEAFAEVWYEIGQVVGCEIFFPDGSALLVRHDAPSVYPHQAPDVLVKGETIDAAVRIEASGLLNAESRSMFQRNPGAPLIYDLATRCGEILQELKDRGKKKAQPVKKQDPNPKRKPFVEATSSSNSVLDGALAEAKGIVKNAAAGGKVFAVRGQSEGVAAGKILGVVKSEQDAQTVNGKKVPNAQREAMHAAAERLAKEKAKEAKANESEEAKAEARAALSRKLQKEAEEKDEREYQERLRKISVADRKSVV